MVEPESVSPPHSSPGRCEVSSANRASIEYHLAEFDIAHAGGDGRHLLPAIPGDCRRVLDVGCGIGQTLAALDLPRTVEAHGVDIDGEAIAFGSARFPNLKLKTSAGESLPYDAGYFDFLYCRVSLPYMHIPRALREFRRVLQPNGHLWLSLHPLSMLRRDLTHALREGSLRGVVYRSYAAFNTLLLFAGRQIPYPLNQKRVESYQPSAIMRLALQRAGFGDIQTFTETDHAIATATCPR